MSIPRVCTENVTTSGNTSQHFTEGKFPLHPISCLVTEERNGEFELEMDIEMSDRYFYEIKIGRIITAPHDSTGEREFFEVYNITHELNGIAHVSAWHVSYRTNGMLILPFTKQNPSPSNIFSSFVSYEVIAGENFFLITSDMATTSSKPFVVKEITTMRNVIKAVIDEFGGELKYQQHIIWHVAQRGKDNGIYFRYGQDIISLTREQTNEDVFVGVYPWWHKSGEGWVTLPEKYVTKSYLNSYYKYYKPIIPLDMSDYFETKPTETELRNAANTWLNTNAPRTIPENIDVSVLQMDSEGKSKIAQLNLCDTVHIYYPEMGIETTSKVTKLVFNVLLDRYESVSIGTATNMNTAIKKVVGIK
jgi:phage minor structural protein